MRFLITTLIWLITVHSVFAQNFSAYRVFNSQGKKSSFKKFLKTAAKSDVVFFGELHNNPISHWLQLQTVKELSKQKPLILGAEMFEADNQEQINLFLEGKINADSLEKTARLWSNFKTDYYPLLQFAKEHKYPFIATNVPRRYASMTYKQGFEVLDSLPDEEKKWIAPLPITYDETLPTYQKMKEMMPGHGGENLPKAQAVKDATMAYFIAKNFEEGKIFVHFNGSYHSDYKEGIVWYLKKRLPDAEIITITTVLQEDIKKLEEEHKNKADFIIVVPEDMTTTY
ncbi:MAG: iron-regulated protein [Bacteroidetes bacterium]|nr:MAG: iron-regulated protein [Bacteroidota bacterium]